MPEIAKTEAEKLNEVYKQVRQLALCDVATFIPFINENYKKPLHLNPLTSIINRIINNEQVFFTIAVPPQHYKTETLAAGIALDLIRNPTKRSIFAGYSQEFAESKTRHIPKILKSFGVQMTVEKSNQIVLEQGGGLITTSVDGQGSGHPCETFYIDDPFSGPAQAYSKIYRNRVWDWFVEVVFARVREGKTSIGIDHTRWHKDDLIGRLQAQNDVPFEHYRIPALYDGLDSLGRPEQHRMELNTPLKESFEFYDKIRNLSPYGFTSKYQGLPVTRGNTIFHEPTYYSVLPDNYKIQIGSDFAYSIKTRADYTVFVIMKASGELYYIIDVIRYQRESPYTKDKIVELYNKYKSIIAAEANGPQKGVFDMIKGSLPYGMLVAKNPTSDKVTRSENLAAAWNSGKILLPDPSLYPCTWLDEYVDEMLNFTGVSDVHDDCIDATVMAYENTYYQPMMYGIN